MNREEATVVLNADVGTIERSLGIGKNYFDRWAKQLKSDQEKYTDWWATELKKREEMEVQSSVRAATRANLARRLVRDRKEATAERVSDELSKGSVPESWQQVGKSGRRAAQEVEGRFHEAGEHMSHEAREVAAELKKTLGGEVASSIKGFMVGSSILIAATALEVWHKLSEFIAEKVYGNDSATEQLLEKTLDRRREFYRKENEQRWEAAKEAEKIRQEQRRAAKENQKLDEELANLSSEERQVKAGSDTAAGRDSERARLNMAVTLRTEEFETAKAAGDRTEQLRAQVEMEKAKLELLRFDTEEEKRQRDIRKQVAEIDRQKAKARQDELKEFMPTVDELSKRGVFKSQARQISRLDRKIKKDFEFGNIDLAKSDLIARDKIYDSLTDRGVLTERATRSRLDELSKQQTELLGRIAEGKAVLKTQIVD